MYFGHRLVFSDTDAYFHKVSVVKFADHPYPGSVYATIPKIEHSVFASLEVLPITSSTKYYHMLAKFTVEN